jgi:hypothetical protein
MRTRLLHLAATVALLLLGRAGPASAQCGVMSLCQFGHVVQGPSAGGLQNLHGECLVCVAGDCHPGCNETLLPDSLRKAAYLAVLDLARRTDAEAVSRFAPELPGLVYVNAQRHSVQVRSCSGEAVIANLPFPDEPSSGSDASIATAGAVPKRVHPQAEVSR